MTVQNQDFNDMRREGEGDAIREAFATASRPGDTLGYHVRKYVPNCPEGEELERRKSLLTARDYAITLITKTKGEVATDHAIAAREAADAFVFADVPLARLELALSYCRHMVQAAFIADHMEQEAQSGL